MRTEILQELYDRRLIRIISSVDQIITLCTWMRDGMGNKPLKSIKGVVLGSNLRRQQIPNGDNGSIGQCNYLAIREEPSFYEHKC